MRKFFLPFGFLLLLGGGQAVFPLNSAIGASLSDSGWDDAGKYGVDEAKETFEKTYGPSKTTGQAGFDEEAAAEEAGILPGKNALPWGEAQSESEEENENNPELEKKSLSNGYGLGVVDAFGHAEIALAGNSGMPKLRQLTAKEKAHKRAEQRLKEKSEKIDYDPMAQRLSFEEKQKFLKLNREMNRQILEQCKKDGRTPARCVLFTTAPPEKLMRYLMKMPLKELFAWSLQARESFNPFTNIAGSILLSAAGTELEERGWCWEADYSPTKTHRFIRCDKEDLESSSLGH